MRRSRGSKMRSDISRIFVSMKYVGKYSSSLGNLSVARTGKITEQIAEQIIDKILYLRVLDVIDVSFSNIYVYTFKKKV